MKQHRFSKGQGMILNEREYVIESRLSNGDMQLKDILANTCVTKPLSELVDALFKGNLTFVVGSYARNKVGRLLSADFTQLPEADREAAKRKYAYVTRVITETLDRRTKESLEPLISAVSKEINDLKPPSWVQVYRWHRDYITAGEDIRSLLPLQKERGNHVRRLSIDVISIINTVINEKYLTTQRVPIRSVYDTVIARIAHENNFRDAGDKIIIPSYWAVYRTINRLDPYEITKARFGKAIADLKYSPKKQGVRPTRPIERVEIDHTKLDLFIVDSERMLPIGRPWLTTAIDVYSKCIVGFYISFNPPSYLSLMQCMRHAVSPKTYVKERYPCIKHAWNAYGLMETAVVDNGKEFHSMDFEDACLQLGIVIQYAPVRLAWYKPSVERHFRTLNMGLLHKQPGTTFSNIFDKGDYDPIKNSVIDLNTLLEIVHTWIIDVYHQDFHRGIREVPARLWDKAVQEFPPALPAKIGDLDALLGMVQYRVISASGIELNGLFYNDEALAALRRGGRTDGRKVKVKFDPSDLGSIHVLDEDSMSFVSIRAANYGYAKGLTLWQHNVIKNFSQKQFGKTDTVNLAIAKERIQLIVDSYLYNSKRKQSHQKAARWLNISQDMVIDATAMESRVAYGYAKPIAVPKALCGQVNDIADIGEAVLDESLPESAQGAVIAPSSSLKADRRRKPKKRPLSFNEKESVPAGLSDIYDEDAELDMTGYSASYSLPKNR